MHGHMTEVIPAALAFMVKLYIWRALYQSGSPPGWVGSVCNPLVFAQWLAKGHRIVFKW